MATSGSSGGCKKCKRDCIVPGFPVYSPGAIPPVFIDLRDKWNMRVYTQALADYVKDGIKNKSYCNGDISAYCLERIIYTFQYEIEKSIRDWTGWDLFPSNTCYEMDFTSGFAITAHCTCNDADIANGNGPPSADVEIDKAAFSSSDIHLTSCGIFT